MNIMNCKPGVPVRIISKSMGQPMSDLKDERIGVIRLIQYDYGCKHKYIVVRTRSHTFNFLPQDLEPLGSVKEWLTAQKLRK